MRRKQEAEREGKVFIPAAISQQEKDALFLAFGIRELPASPSMGMLNVLQHARNLKRQKEKVGERRAAQRARMQRLSGQNYGQSRR